MASQIKLRRDTAANWTAANPVLGAGEPGYDTTNNKLKIGNGSTAWNSLTYFDDKETVLSNYSGHIVPSANNTYDLGSATNQWRSLYVSASTIYLGGTPLSVDGSGNLIVDGSPVTGGSSDRLIAGSNSVILNAQGDLELPTKFPIQFSPVFDAAHYNGDGTFQGDGTASFTIELQGQGATFQWLADDPVFVTDRGYVGQQEFRYTEADHGITGYNLDITMEMSGSGPYSLNVALSPPPGPADLAKIRSTDELMVKVATKGWMFDANGDIYLPANGTIRNSTGTSVIFDGSLSTALGNDIAISSGDDIILQGKNLPGTDSEGGDIRLYAGNSDPSNGGGDIEIYAGEAGALDGPEDYGNTGGNVTIAAGLGVGYTARGGNISLQGGSGDRNPGGSIDISAGNGGFNGPKLSGAALNFIENSTPIRVHFSSIHRLTSGDSIVFSGITTTTDLNDKKFYVVDINDYQVELYWDRGVTLAVNGSGFVNYSTTVVSAVNGNLQGNNIFSEYTSNYPDLVNVLPGDAISGVGINDYKLVTAVSEPVPGLIQIEIDGSDGSVFLTGQSYTFVRGGGGTVSSSAHGGDINISAGETFIDTLGDHGSLYFGSGSQEWVFKAGGSTLFPTLTVPISDNANPSGTGQTLKFADSTQQAIIFGPSSTPQNNSAERVIIQGAPGYTGTQGEGGDVYLWAGPGGDAGGDGGDIKVRAGLGINSGNGGYLNFQAGDSNAGYGGYINIESGESITNNGGSMIVRAGDSVGANGGQTQVEAGNTTTGDGGDLLLYSGDTVTGNGGSIAITSGDTVTGNAGVINITAGAAVTGPGGTINLTAGSTVTGDGGDISLTTGDNISGGNPGIITLRTINATVAKEWIFDFNGHLTLPQSGVIQETTVTNELWGTTTTSLTLVPGGAANTAQRLEIYSTGGGEGDHIHITSGDQSQTDLFLGNDTQYFAVAANGANYIQGRPGAASTGPGIYADPGANVNIYAGNAGDNGGDAAYGNSGGDVYIASGISTSGLGGQIFLQTSSGPSGFGSIKLSTDGGSSYLEFNEANQLVFPGGRIIDPSDDNFEVRGSTNINFEATNTVNIYTDTGNNGYQWQFDDNGTLIFPDTTVQTTAWTGTVTRTIQTVSVQTPTGITGSVVFADANAAGGNVNLVLPNNSANGTEVTVKNINAGGFSVFVSTDGVQNVETESGTIGSGVYATISASGGRITWIYQSATTTWRIIG